MNSTSRRNSGRLVPASLVCVIASVSLLAIEQPLAWAESAVVNGVELREMGQAATLEIRTSGGRPNYTTERRDSPLRLLVWLPDLAPSPQLLEAPTTLASGSSGVSKVVVYDAVQANKGTGTIVVVYFSGRARVRTETTPSGILRVHLNESSSQPGRGSTPELAPATEPDRPPVRAASRGRTSGEILSIAMSRVGANVLVVVRSSSPLLYETQRPGATTFTVEFAGARLADGVQPAWVGDEHPSLPEVRVEQLRRDTSAVRLTLECADSSQCTVTPGPNSHTAIIEVPAPSGAPADAPTGASGPEELSASTEPVAVLVPPIADGAAVGESPAEPSAPPDVGDVTGEANDGQAAATVASPSSDLGTLGEPTEVGWSPLGDTTTLGQSGGYQTIPGGPLRRPASNRPPGEAVPVPGVISTPTFLSEGTIAIDFPNTPVADALSAIAHHADLDIIVDETAAQGSVAVTMTDVTPEQAINMICGIRGLVWVKQGRTYIVASREGIQKYLAISDRVVMTYAPQHSDDFSMGQYKELLDKLHPRVFVQVYQNPQVLVLAGDGTDVEAAIRTLRDADVMRGEIYAGGQHVDVYTLQSGDATKVAQFVQQVFPDGLQVIHREGTQQLVLKGSRADVTKSVELLRELDAQGGKIVTVTYKPANHSANVIQAAVKEGFPSIATQVVSDTLLITGTETDANAALEYAKAADLSLARRAEATEVYHVSTRHVRGLSLLAEEAFPELTIRAAPQAKTVTVMGARELVDACMARLAIWDAPTSEVVTRNVRVLHQDPGFLAETLVGLDLDPAFKAQASGDVVSITGPPIAVAEAQAVIDETDVPVTQATIARNIVSERYVLRYADLAECQRMLASAFGEAKTVEPGERLQLTGISPGGTLPSLPGAASGPADATGAFGQGMGVQPPFGPGGPPVGGGGPGLGGIPDAGLFGVPGGADLGMGAAAGSGLQPGSVPAAPPSAPAVGAMDSWLSVAPDQLNHSLLITGPRWAVDRAIALLEQFDVTPHQVLIECIIADVNRSYLKDKGIEWDWGNTRFVETGETDGYGTGIGLRRIDRLAFDWRADLFLQETRGNSKLLATPSLLARDGTPMDECKIQIGDELRFQVLQPVAGGAPVYTIERVDVGIILHFEPRVTGDGHVALKLHAESSSISGFTPQGYPEIRKRTADTSVVLRDGDTIVIGGLIREEEIQSVRSVPFLSKIPFLGQLFRHREIDSRPQELVFFITPRIAYADDHKLAGIRSSVDLQAPSPVIPYGAAAAAAETTSGAVEDATVGSGVDAEVPTRHASRASRPRGRPVEPQGSEDVGPDPSRLPPTGALQRSLRNG